MGREPIASFFTFARLTFPLYERLPVILFNCGCIILPLFSKEIGVDRKGCSLHAVHQFGRSTSFTLVNERNPGTQSLVDHCIFLETFCLFGIKTM
ncbi:hypothetical protein AMTRI_Chr01g113510 [Amborella trichopoda]